MVSTESDVPSRAGALKHTLRDGGFVRGETGLRAGSDRADATALAGAVQHAIAEAFNPTPREAQSGFPVQDFMGALLRGADELGIELSRDEILDIFEAALRRHASLVIGDQLRGVLAGPFGQQNQSHEPRAIP